MLSDLFIVVFLDLFINLFLTVRLCCQPEKSGLSQTLECVISAAIFPPEGGLLLWERYKENIDMFINTNIL